MSFVIIRIPLEEKMQILICQFLLKSVVCYFLSPSSGFSKTQTRKHDRFSIFPHSLLYQTDAEAAGFRSYLRCKPDEPSLREQHADKVTEICRLPETAEIKPSLAELATIAGLTPSFLGCKLGTFEMILIRLPWRN